MNDENLVSLKDRTPEERIRIGRMGAAITNKKKKQKRMWRDILNTIGSANAGEKYKDKLKEFGIEETSFENVMIVNGIAVPAIKGDKWAIEQWGKMTGNLKENVNIEGNVNLTKAQKEIEDLLND